MKLLLIAHQYFPPTLGGSAIAFRRLAHGLAARGHTVTVVAPGADGLRTYREQDGPTGVLRVRALPLPSSPKRRGSGPRIPLFAARLVARAVEEAAPDLIHIVTPTFFGGVAREQAGRRGIPVIASNHAVADNLIPFGYRREWPAYRAWDRLYWARLVAFLNRCDAVTSPTQAACDLLRAHGLVRPAVPISNGVDLSVFRPPLPGEKARLRAGFGLPADRPVVLYAGRLAREKGLDVLLAAMPLVLARVPCHFLVVGAGDLDVRAMAAQAGLSAADITLTGLVGDARVAEAYRAADVLALPSACELQGLVLLEGAASGLPLVGADALAIPAIVRHGENGLLHAPGSAPALADALAALAGDAALRRLFSAAGLTLVQRHALGACVAQMEEVYRAALGARPRPPAPRR